MKTQTNMSPPSALAAEVKDIINNHLAANTKLFPCEWLMYRGVGPSTVDYLRTLGVVEDDPFETLRTQTREVLRKCQIRSVQEAMEKVNDGTLACGKIDNFGYEAFADLARLLIKVASSRAISSDSES